MRPTEGDRPATGVATLSGYRTEGRRLAQAAVALFVSDDKFYREDDKRMNKQTPLYEEHLTDGGKLVDFAGWEMPINYGSQIEEHNTVRQDAGMFDVSHMTVVDLTGERTREFLRYLLANNVDRLKDSGKALDRKSVV